MCPLSKMRTLDKVALRFHAPNMLFPSITTALSEKCGSYFEVKVAGISAAKLTVIIIFETQSLWTSKAQTNTTQSLGIDKRLMR